MITKPQNHQTCTSNICLTYSPFLFIRRGAFQVQFFFYSNEPIPPLWPTYKGERRTTFAKAYGIKVSCYRELFGEHVENLGNFLLLLPPTKRGERKACMESEQWIVHPPHQTQLDKNPPPTPQPIRKKMETPCCFPP